MTASLVVLLCCLCGWGMLFGALLVGLQVDCLWLILV